MFSRLGTQDPRLDKFGKIDFRIYRQTRSYKKKDGPKHRVKPLPVCIVIQILSFAQRQGATKRTKAIARLICIAFYFLLRPGEYTGTTTDDQAFSLDDVHLYHHDRKLCIRTAPVDDIRAATKVLLTFTTQKNMDYGQQIAHSRSGDASCCPVLATIDQVLMHRSAFDRFSPPFDDSVKLASYYSPSGRNFALPATAFTDTIRSHAALLRAQTGLAPSEFTARSLYSLEAVTVTLSNSWDAGEAML